jgi:hypothetical protein
MLCYIRNQLLEQDDVSRVVEEMLIIVTRAIYYKPMNNTFISSINLELMESPTQMKKNAVDTMRIKSTLLPLVTTTKRVTSTIGSELPIQHSATSTDRLPVLQDLVLLAAEIKALDCQDKLEEDSLADQNLLLRLTRHCLELISPNLTLHPPTLIPIVSVLLSIGKSEYISYDVHSQRKFQCYNPYGE